VFKPSNKKELEPHPLDEAITSAIEGLKGLDDGSPEMDRAVANIKSLMEVRRLDRDDHKKLNVDHDVLATIAGQLAGIFAILSFEKANIITTKALMLIPRGRH
jgi:hypothetical protein